MWLTWVLCSGSHKIMPEGWIVWVPFWRPWGRIQFQAHFLPEFRSLWLLGLKHHFFPLAVSCGCSHPGGWSQVIVLWPSPSSKPARENLPHFESLHAPNFFCQEEPSPYLKAHLIRSDIQSNQLFLISTVQYHKLIMVVVIPSYSHFIAILNGGII